MLWVDEDKVPCPKHIDPVERPIEAAAWMRRLLPTPFKEAECIYKFSSSHGVYDRETISGHLIFWLDRKVDEQEIKRFFKANPCPADSKLYNPVQPHFTAAPVFGKGLHDPLIFRLGILQGKTKVVTLPDIPEPPKAQLTKFIRTAVMLSEEQEEAALKRLLDFYPQEGGRNRFCATLAAVLYRGGWEPEIIADFIYQLAENAKDEESWDRQDNALRICDTIEKEEG